MKISIVAQAFGLLLSLIKVVYSFLAKNELAQGCQIFLGT
jgi:hypothetical protein